MSTDVLETLARENPVRAAVPDAVSEDLLRGILATPIEHRRRRPRAHLLAIPALAVVMVAAAAALLPGERVGPSSAAAQALERLASVAAAQPAPPVDGWAYSRVRTLYGATNIDGTKPYTVLNPSVRESWIAADGSGRIIETSGKPIFLNDSDRARWVAAGGRTEALPPTERRFRSLPTSVALYADVAGLPTDPDELEVVLRRKVENENPPPESGYAVVGELRSLVSSLLHSPASSGELRSALYRVLARIEGIELVGRVTDPIGRVGIGLKSAGGYGDDPTSRLLIVDPQTAEVLAEQSIVERRVEYMDVEPGGVYGEIVYLEQGWTDSIDERPSRR